MNELQLLTVSDVRELLAVGKTTLYQLISAGKFPAPIRFTKRTVRWRSTDLKTWLEHGKHQTTAISSEKNP